MLSQIFVKIEPQHEYLVWFLPVQIGCWIILLIRYFSRWKSPDSWMCGFVSWWNSQEMAMQKPWSAGWRTRRPAALLTLSRQQEHPD